MRDLNTDLLQALLHVSGRVAVAPDELRRMVTAGGGGKKQIEAFNLCDGTKSQTQIAKELRINSGNFSRTVKRWLTLGLVFKVGEESLLLHLYKVE